MKPFMPGFHLISNWLRHSILMFGCTKALLFTTHAYFNCVSV